MQESQMMEEEDVPISRSPSESSRDHDGQNGSRWADQDADDMSAAGGLPRIPVKCRTLEAATIEMECQTRTKLAYKDVEVSLEEELDKLRARKAMIQALLGTSRLPAIGGIGEDGGGYQYNGIVANMPMLAYNGRPQEMIFHSHTHTTHPQLTQQGGGPMMPIPHRGSPHHHHMGADRDDQYNYVFSHD